MCNWLMGDMAVTAFLYKKFTAPPNYEQVCINRARHLLGAFELLRFDNGGVAEISLKQQKPGDIKFRSGGHYDKRIIEEFRKHYLGKDFEAACPQGLKLPMGSPY